MYVPCTVFVQKLVLAFQMGFSLKLDKKERARERERNERDRIQFQ